MNLILVLLVILVLCVLYDEIEKFKQSSKPLTKADTTVWKQLFNKDKYAQPKASETNSIVGAKPNLDDVQSNFI